MPRRRRNRDDAGVFHVWGCAGRFHPRPFSNPVMAREFWCTLHRAKERYPVVVYAWCLLPSSFHLVLRLEGVPLGTIMAFLCRQVARRYNEYQGVRGAFWRERYQAVRLRTLEDFRQAVAYVHVRPVVEGLASDPGGYPWSGHHELNGGGAQQLLDGVRLLAGFGRTRRRALEAYHALLQGGGVHWFRGPVRRLPWWRKKAVDTGPMGEDDSLLAAAGVDRAVAYARWAYAVLGLANEPLTSRRRGPVTTAREILLLVGVLSARLPLARLAGAVGLTPSGASRALARAELKLACDSLFARRVARLRHLLKDWAPPAAIAIEPRLEMSEGGVPLGQWPQGQRLVEINISALAARPAGAAGEQGSEGIIPRRPDIYVDPTPRRHPAEHERVRSAANLPGLVHDFGGKWGRRNGYHDTDTVDGA